MIYLRSLSFYIVYVVSGLLAGIAGCLIGPFLNIGNRIKFLSSWPKFANWVLYKSCKIEVIVEGSENIPNAPFVIASNRLVSPRVNANEAVPLAISASSWPANQTLPE